MYCRLFVNEGGRRNPYILHVKYTCTVVAQSSASTSSSLLQVGTYMYDKVSDFNYSFLPLSFLERGRCFLPTKEGQIW